MRNGLIALVFFCIAGVTPVGAAPVCNGTTCTEEAAAGTAAASGCSSCRATSQSAVIRGQRVVLFPKLAARREARRAR